MSNFKNKKYLSFEIKILTILNPNKTRLKYQIKIFNNGKSF